MQKRQRRGGERDRQRDGEGDGGETDGGEVGKDRRGETEMKRQTGRDAEPGAAAARWSWRISSRIFGGKKIVALMSSTII